MSAWNENEYGHGGFFEMGKRMFGKGHRTGLRFFILKLLSKKSMTGAEIISAMESTTHGWWRPSPGSIYPLMETLVDEGLVTVSSTEGVKKTYTITEKGKEYVMDWMPPWFNINVNGFTVEDMLKEMGHNIRFIEDNVDRIKGNSELKKELENLKERLNKIIEHM
ncbi:MAG: PadR family transcriptional regulator [Candidatus Thermoplasmatota archaeon]|jgi:DNA-binding PadR family transcriptional regulator|nr:PadR family transcriptional regulator [Candidatus Thermoplasmatota archaeon]MCL5963012.1 PadR family transcriptional regulator [Candidatus Thermoplasmatota archaeon]